MQAILRDVIELTPDIRQYWFKPEKRLHFTAGQFLEVRLPHTDVDDRGDSRWFTICSDPADELFCITTRHDYAHGSSFKNALLAMAPGDQLQISEPLGDFVLPIDTSRPIIFVAGGIGITPFTSMLLQQAHASEARAITLLYAVSNESEIIFQDVFEDAGVHATIVVENASAEWGGERGRIKAEQVIGLKQPAADSLLYLSGPEPMVEALAADLKQKGISDNQIVTDTFPGYKTI